MLSTMTLYVLVDLLDCRLLRRFRIIIEGNRVGIYLTITTYVRHDLCRILLRQDTGLVLVLIRLRRSLERLAVIRSL